MVENFSSDPPVIIMTFPEDGSKLPDTITYGSSHSRSLVQGNRLMPAYEYLEYNKAHDIIHRAYENLDNPNTLYLAHDDFNNIIRDGLQGKLQVLINNQEVNPDNIEHLKKYYIDPANEEYEDLFEGMKDIDPDEYNKLKDKFYNSTFKSDVGESPRGELPGTSGSTKSMLPSLN